MRFFIIAALIIGFLSAPNFAWSQDKIVIEIGPPNRAVEVISPTFFNERSRPSQMTFNRYGEMRYYGDAPTITGEQREAWIESCQNRSGRLRDCYKQMQRNAEKK